MGVVSNSNNNLFVVIVGVFIKDIINCGIVWLINLSVRLYSSDVIIIGVVSENVSVK